MLKINVNPAFKMVGQKFKRINLEPSIKEGVRKYAMMVLGESKRVTPVDTGRLKESERVDMQPMRAIVAPHTNYAVYVHEGTRFMRARPYMEWGLMTAQEKMRGRNDPVLNQISGYLNKEFKK